MSSAEIFQRMLTLGGKIACYILWVMCDLCHLKGGNHEREEDSHVTDVRRPKMHNFANRMKPPALQDRHNMMTSIEDTQLMIIQWNWVIITKKGGKKK